MTTVPPSRDDGERPLFSDPGGTDQPFDAPIVRRPGQVRAVPPPPPAQYEAPPRPPTYAPPSAPAAPPAQPQTVHKGLLLGRVNGQMSVVRRPQHFYGLPILVMVLLATLAAVCLYAAGSMLVALLIAFVLLTLLFSFAMRPITALMLAVMRSVVALISSLLIRATLLSGKAVKGTVSRTNVQQDITIRRFQVQLVSGQYVTCLMYGDLTGDEPRKDDHVGIKGRHRKDHYVVRSVHVFAPRGGQVVRQVHARRPLGLRIMRLVDAVSYVLAGLAVAGLLSEMF
ncbi:hypothetical protein [Allorhizocola rhizosphaerae]|uniref:hypothetical protein n=1 Tax=Allorhizocola rhizosphaerae TaxID=1872709 RepID=UPI000E3C9E7F|nr:hypothetical protein [Allorhizocola rhizosphaerae]